ncbi:hypothetical protein [Mycoplasma sp. SG1]|uniref:hypothetical protein n=1 Tax=Mycoplasma sp. SG1 TaxID=2810348 RepID=UPI002024C679|nr:hypothetical protein [Mycoplasma sp. SG1]URM53055.1 hypothetical protein JRW51_01775 [Mycoplasma sp. SG1]
MSPRSSNLNNPKFNNNYSKTFKFAFACIFTSLAVVFNFITIPYIPYAFPLNLNFSLVALLIIQYYCGFVLWIPSFATYIILSCVFSSFHIGGMVGVLAWFCAFFVYQLLFEFFLRIKFISFSTIQLKNLIFDIISFTLITLITSLWMVLANYLFLLYLWGIEWKGSFFGYLFGFNLIQFAVISTFSFLFIVLFARILSKNF